MSTTALAVSTGGWAMNPADTGQAMKMAEFMSKSGLVPKDFAGQPSKILVAAAMGEKVGLDPFSAMAGIAVINGRPALWGTVMRGIVLASNKFAGLEEYIEGEGDDRVAVCILKRDNAKPYKATFSVKQAKHAKLWGNNVWEKYPEDMLRHRAFSRAAKSIFADVLSGFDSAEEMRDVEIIKEVEVVESKPASEDARPARSRKSTKQIADEKDKEAEQKVMEREAQKERRGKPFVQPADTKDEPFVPDADPQGEAVEPEVDDRFDLADEKNVTTMDVTELIDHAKEVAAIVGNKKVKAALYEFTKDEKLKVGDCPPEHFQQLYDNLELLSEQHEAESK